ncbi:MAG: Protein of unknown function DUF61 [uncultured Acidilobus sp. JCHS]|nr:MAG: Protein of unknown function DUF61 [uncultured Acidilobus sp. JCHS]
MMSGEASNLAERVRSRWREEVRRLQAHWPAEQVTLEELKVRRSVSLADGTVHEMDPEEVERLLRVVPPYFRPFMRVPLLLSYVKEEDGAARYLVMGDRWQRRLAELMVRGDYSSEGITELSVDEFVKLLREFRSLVFVSLSLA